MTIRSAPEVIAELHNICERTSKSIEELHPADGGLLVSNDWQPSPAVAALIELLRAHLRSARDLIRKLGG